LLSLATHSAAYFALQKQLTTVQCDRELLLHLLS
jgi:hypothetical protein